MRRPAVIALLSLLAGGPAAANDTVAELRAGGLVFVRSEAVSMVSEDLHLSLDEVRVDYVFRNDTDRAETATVAFPMPALEGSPWRVPAVPEADQPNFLGFEVTVDGRPVQPNLQQRAEVAGIDVTEVLKASGLPLEPFAEKTRAAIESLTDEARRALARKGLLVVDAYDDGTGMRDHHFPYWTLRTTYFWEMTFPPGAETRVSHRYRPAVGTTAGLSFMEDGGFTGKRYADYATRYCMDTAFLEALQARVEAVGVADAAFEENRIAYVLTTGRNWAGPIGTFRLTVDKGDPQNLVSFCAEGATATGPTTVSVTYENFEPDRDLEVLILSVPK